MSQLQACLALPRFHVIQPWNTHLSRLRAALELAINGHADLIVSGDTDLLALNPFRLHRLLCSPGISGQGGAQ
jgi:hypothetical protein